MMLRAIFIGLPALTLALGIPLVLKLVLPNRFYGFRTTTELFVCRCLVSAQLCHGLALVAGGAVAGLLALFLSHGMFTLKPEVRYLAGIVLTGLITLAFLFPVVIYSNKW